jgi:hypothetical protein
MSITPVIQKRGNMPFTKEIEDNKVFTVEVESENLKGQILINVNGEDQIADKFEIVLPTGGTVKLKKVLRIETE